MKYNCLIIDDEKVLADSTAEYFNLFGVNTVAVYGVEDCRRFFKDNIIGVLLVLIAEIITLIVFAVETPNFSQDTVAVNEVMQSVTEDFNILEEHKNTTALDYVVLDENGNLLYKTKSGLSESVNEAITHRDTILDITTDSGIVGKVIIYNDGAQTLQ